MQEITMKKNYASIMAFISAASFGAYPIFAKYAYEFGVNVPTVLFLRFTGCITLLWLYLILTKRNEKFELKSSIKLMIVGGIIYSSMSALNLLAVTMISASLASLLLCTYPIFVTIVTIIIGDDFINPEKAIALVVSFIGMALLLNVDFSNIRVLGIIFGMAASFAYTAYVVVGNRLQKGLEPIKSATLIMTGAAITYTLYGLFSGSVSFDFPTAGWISMAGMILCSTVFAIALFWASIKIIGPAKASIIGTVEPLVTVLLAAIIFRERMNLLQYIGSVLIVIGVIAIQRSKNIESPLKEHV